MTLEINPPPIESGWGQDSKRGPVIVWALWFQNIWLALQHAVAPVSWTPVPANLTVVGAATLTGSYTQVGNLVHFSISISTTGTTASTAGTTTLTLPFTAAENDLCAAAELTSYTSYGNGIIATNTMTVFPPSWAATANVVIISGTCRIS